ncbi:MAG: hypothetical protein H7288_05005 [Kineosporiaceae bacterium]|nr:hypothetical protein [Aeromicrobium sp.]
MDDGTDSLEAVLGRTADAVRRPEPVDPARLVSVRVEASESERYAYGKGPQDPISCARHATWRFYYEDAELHSEVEYIDGQLHGVSRVWYPDGQIWAEENYVRGKRQGPWTNWHEDGSLKRRGEMKDDQYEGHWFFRNADGSWYEAEMVRGLTHGITRYFGPTGYHFATARWEHGSRLWQYIRRPDFSWWREQWDGGSEPVSAAPAERAPCPCCGYLTLVVNLPAENRDWTCPVCRWVMDNAQNHDSRAAGPNPLTLEQARRSFEESSAANPGDSRVRTPHEEELLE